MAKNKEQKLEALSGVKDKMAKSQSVVFSADQGLNVKTIEKMRRELKEKGGEYLVVKKTLLSKALADFEGSEEQVNNLSGSVALSFSYDDPTTAAAVLNKYAKENDKLVLGGGIMENKIIMPEMVKRLASLLSREQLLSKLVGSLKSPVTGFVGVLSGNLRNLVGVLSAIRDKK